MLSTSAFNALLKTMEEPPPHVKFILCTTEPHKVPATIHSRCQGFDFRNIPTPKIAEHLTDVLAKESVEAEQQVVWQIARLANGSMRDGLSLLDRLIATGQSPLTPQVLEQMFGLPDAQLIGALVDALANGDVKGSLESVAHLISNGISQDQIFEVLIERFRQLMLLSACGPDSDLIELPEDAKAGAVEQAKRFDAAGLTYMIALCESVQRNGKASATPRALLDATIVRLALAEKMADVTAVLSGNAGVTSGGGGGAEQKKKLTSDPNASTSADRASAPLSHHQPPATSHQPPTTPYTPTPTPSTQAPAPDPQPQVEIDTTNLPAVMAALRDRVADRPAYAWLRFVNLDKLDDQTAQFSPTPGHREVMHFAKDQRRLQGITDELTPILGRRVQVSVNAPAATNHADDNPTGPTDPASPQTQAPRPTGAADRRAAMDLPLVKQVMDVFPDAVLFDVREEGRADSQAD